MKLARRITELPELQTIAMAKKSRELQAKGVDVINLSLGEPDFFTPDAIKEAAVAAIHQNFSFYPPIPGYLDLRKAIVEKLQQENGITATHEQIVVSTGAKQAIANVVLSLIEKGDEVIIPAPYWVSYPNIVQLAEGAIKVLPTSLETGFKVTPSQLKAAITPQTRLIILCSPSNPTGAVYSAMELQALAKVVLGFPELYVLADEIYEYIYFKEKPTSLAAIPGMDERVITVNGFSKGYAMTGWRLGYACAPKWLSEACEKMQSQITSGACSITQRAAIAALKMDKKELDVMRKAFGSRLDVFFSELKCIPGLKIYPPDGAFYVFPDVSDYLGKKTPSGQIISGVHALSLYLLEEAHVATVPGDAFGAPSCIRLSFAIAEDKLKEAAKRLAVGFSRLL